MFIYYDVDNFEKKKKNQDRGASGLDLIAEGEE